MGNDFKTSHDLPLTPQTQSNIQPLIEQVPFQSATEQAPIAEKQHMIVSVSQQNDTSVRLAQQVHNSGMQITTNTDILRDRIRLMTPEIAKLLTHFHSAWQKAASEIKTMQSDKRKKAKQQLDALVKERFKEELKRIQTNKRNQV